MERHLRRSYPAVRACLRASGVAPGKLDAGLRAVYARALERGIPVSRALLGVLSQATTSVPEVDLAGPPARELLAAFVSELDPGGRVLFAASELGGATPALLAAEYGVDERAARRELARLRRSFAAYVGAYGIPARELLRAAAICERLPIADEDALWRALERLAVVTVPVGRRPHPGIWLLMASPALLLATYLFVVEQSSSTGGLSVALEGSRAAVAAAAEVPEPAPAPEPEPSPEPEPEPEPEVSPTEAPTRVAKRRGGGGGSRRQSKLAKREALAKERDPGQVIVELEMLKAVKGALGTKPAKALAIAEQHARDFPKSQLRESRERLQIQALCALGRTAQARSLASSIQAAHPSSKVGEVLRTRCLGA